MKSKASWLAVFLFSCILSCANPQDNPSDYVLSNNEKNNISNLAAGIRNYPIDSITVRNMHPSSYFFGLVNYKPEFIDTDKVIFSELKFCNTTWPYYSIFIRYDSNLTIVNGWASSPRFLHLDTATLVKFESCSLYIHNNDQPSKDTIIHYLDKIYRNDYVASSSCVNCVFRDSIYNISGFSCVQRADSLTISVTCEYIYSAVFYRFVEVNGVLILLSIGVAIA